jgi:hypothetical protein
MSVGKPLALVLSTLAAGGTAVVVSALPAEAVTCPTPSVTLTQDSAKRLISTSAATCTGNITRTLYAEVKWDKSEAPDPLVAKNSDTGTKTSLKAVAASCDNGNTRGYYARGYWSGGSYVDDGPRVVKAC